MGPETEPDWIDAPEDFEPLPGPEDETPSAWREHKTKRARNRRGTEPDWIDPPEAFGPLSADDIEARTSGFSGAPTEAQATGSEPDRVVGPTGTQPPATPETKSDPQTRESDDKAKIVDGDRSPPADEVQRDISARFAEAFLAELGSDQSPHVDTESTVPAKGDKPAAGETASRNEKPDKPSADVRRAKAVEKEKPVAAADLSFEEQLRRMFRAAAKRE